MTTHAILVQAQDYYVLGRLPPGVNPIRDLAQFQPVSGAEYSETNHAAREYVRESGGVAM